MTESTATRLSALAGALAIILGAFGAHGLKDTLTQNGMIAIWEKAAWYHLVHAVILFVLAQRPPVKSGPWWCFFVGIVLFSGSLYLLALTGSHWLGAITPFGGMCFIAGWIWLAVRAASVPSSK